MKHPQHILAFDKAAFGPLADGISRMGINEFMERAEGSLFIGRRHELEQNKAFGQVLPYVMFIRDRMVFLYRRTKLVGEERLAGKTSVGIGGHIDLSDVVFDEKSVINVVATMALAVNREIHEELEFTDDDGGDVALPAPTILGIINDTSDEVGSVHYGVLMMVELPSGTQMRCREDELQTIGFVDISTGLQEAENWTNLALRFIS